jgi:WD40 repeat protein
LCHNSLDKPVVKEIADRLELEFGVPHFLDSFAIPTGEEFMPWIEEALQASTGCAIFLGANGWGPTHRWEAERAVARRAIDPTFRLIPVVLPGITEEDMSSLGDGILFRDLNWADLRSGLNDQDGLDRLYSALTGEVLPEGRSPANLTPYQIRRDAARWQKLQQRDESILYRGAQLKEAERITKAIPDFTRATEIAPFLLASGARQRAIWRRLALVSIGVGIVVIGLAIFAETLRELAEERRTLAVSRQLVLESKAEATPAISLLLAAQAYSEAKTPEAAGNLLARIQAWPHLTKILYGHVNALTKVAIDDESKTILVGSKSGSLLRWSSEILLPQGSALLQASKGAVRSIGVAPGRNEVWVGYEDGRVLVWNKEGVRTTVPGIPPGIDFVQIADVNSLKLGPTIEAIAFSNDGQFAAIGTADGTSDGLIFLVDPEKKAVLDSPISVGEPRVNTLHFNWHSDLLLAGTGYGQVLVIDPRARRTVSLNGAKLSEILVTGFTEDGAIIAVDTVGQTAIWKPSGSFFRLVSSFETTDYLTAAAIRQDGEMVALGDGRGLIHLFRLTTHDRATMFQAHTGPVNGLAWDMGGRRLVSTGSDGTVGIWDFQNDSPLVTPRGRLDPQVMIMHALPGGELIAGRSSVGAAGVWSWVNGKWKEKLDLLEATTVMLGQRGFNYSKIDDSPKDGFVPIATPEVEFLDIDPQGTHVAWSIQEGSVLSSSLKGNSDVSVVWNGAKIGNGNIDALRLSDSGRYLAVAFANRLALLFDLADKDYEAKKMTVPASIRSMDFNKSETLLAMGLEDGSIALWSVPEGNTIKFARNAYSTAVGNVTFSPDDLLLLSNAVVGDGLETAITLAPIPSLSPRRPLVARSKGMPPAMITVYGELLVEGDFDGQVLFWDIENLQPVGSMTASRLPLSAMTIDNENRRLVIADAEGIIQSWEMDSQKWQAIACQIANRTMTPAEWTQFLKDEDYEPICKG